MGLMIGVILGDRTVDLLRQKTVEVQGIDIPLKTSAKT